MGRAAGCAATGSLGGIGSGVKSGKGSRSGAISRFGLQGPQRGAAFFRQEALFLFDHFRVLLGQVDDPLVGDDLGFRVIEEG